MPNEVSRTPIRLPEPGRLTIAGEVDVPLEFVCVPACGHAPQMERPRFVNRLVVDFLTRPM